MAPAKLAPDGGAPGRPPKPTATAPENDLVCGMDVEPGKARAAGLVIHHDGKEYLFCAESCKKRFDADPAKYVGR